MDKMDKAAAAAQVLAVVGAVLLPVSFFVSLFGSNTVHYQCKYVENIKVLVADHEKYADAAYEITYSDGTKGADNQIGGQGPQGIDRGVVCKTVLNWGWPYSFTNRDVQDQPSVRQQLRRGGN